MRALLTPAGGDRQRSQAALQMSLGIAALAGGLILLSDLAIGIRLGFAALALFALHYHLRRVLRKLDSDATAPDRFHMAFNALMEGVMILDASGRIVLVNDSFLKLRPGDTTPLLGRLPSEIQWLCDAFVDTHPLPWTQAMAERTQVVGLGVEISQPGLRTVHRAIVNCAPVFDLSGTVCGCLTTFADLTALDHANSELMKVLEELQHSREQIERQNTELTRLATRDPLTGCYNRRAFFELAEPMFASARSAGRPLCCVVGDIDLFKPFNDKYGHSVGDKVIQAVARYLVTELREVDLLCRYGGEEFCIMLPDATLAQAVDVAERLRKAVHSHAGASIRTTSGLQISISFGVASSADGATDLIGLIDQADEALYVSKQKGRNRVTRWEKVVTV
jgi:diguanylate cyclase (GGDEF)-like protein